MFEKTLRKVVDEQLAEWLLSRILDMVQLEIQAIDICIAVCKRNNAVVVLRTESENEECSKSYNRTYIRIDTKFVVIPCVVQIAPQRNEVLQRINF